MLGEIYAPKDNISYSTLNKYFSFSQIYIFDENNNLVDCNLQSLAGQCFQDIADDICDNFKVRQANLDNNIKAPRVHDLIVENSANISISSSAVDIYNPKFTIV